MVEDTIAKACRNLVLYGQDPKHDMEIGGKRVYYGTAGAATQVIDPIAREYRNATVQDLYNAARIVDRMDNIHFFQRPLTPTDVNDLQTLDINTLYGPIAGTTKHVGCSFTLGTNMKMVFELLHHVAGGLLVALTFAQLAFRETSDDWLKKQDLAVTFLDRYGKEVGKRGILHDDSIALDQLPDHQVEWPPVKLDRLPAEPSVETYPTDIPQVVKHRWD